MHCKNHYSNTWNGKYHYIDEFFTIACTGSFQNDSFSYAANNENLIKIHCIDSTILEYTDKSQSHAEFLHVRYICQGDNLPIELQGFDNQKHSPILPPLVRHDNKHSIQ